MNIKIIDNFLNKEDFFELCSLNLKKVKSNEILVYHNNIYKNGKLTYVNIRNYVISSLIH